MTENIEEKKDDPLSELFVEKTNADSHERLRDLVKNYIQFSSEGEMFFLPEFAKLTNTKKIILVLLGKKILSIKLEQEEYTAPAEIQNITGLPEGSIRPLLRKLYEKRLLLSRDGKYIVPSHVLYTIQQEVFGDVRG